MKGHPRQIAKAAAMIMAAERPVLYIGGGILKARAAEALRALAELIDVHVVTTLMARGAFPDDHPLCLGMPGMHGSYTPSPPCSGPTCSSRSAPASTTGSPASSTASPPRPRSSTPTSTRPSSARSATPTCRSSATAG
jgi:hypothetical protein